MATILENANRIKAAADDIREVIDLCYEEVGDDERIEDYAPKLARLAVDDATEQVIATAARTTAGGVAIKDSIAVVDKVYGNTLVWCQLGTPINASRFEIVVTKSGKRAILNGTGTNESNSYLGIVRAAGNVIAGHKYLNAYISQNEQLAWCSFNNGGRTRSIFTTDASHSFNYAISVAPTTTFENFWVIPILFDLTRMFGAGQEPTSLDDFCLKIFGKESASVTDAEWEAISAYCEPTLLSSKPKKVVSSSRNLYDGMFEAGGIDPSLGGNRNTDADIENYCRAISIIGIEPNEKYYLKINDGTFYIYFYDVNKSFLGKGLRFSNSKSSEFITPSDAKYLRLCAKKQCFDSDICLNVSDELNGEVSEYFNTIELTIDTTAIVDEEGEQVFPDGLLSAGSAKDYIDLERGVAVKCVGEFNIGNYDWFIRTVSDSTKSVDVFEVNLRNFPFKYPTANNVLINSVCDTYDCSNSAYYLFTSGKNGFAVQVNGFRIIDNSITSVNELKQKIADAKAYIELATPIEYPLPKRKCFYRVSNGGKEYITSDGIIPMVADIAYREAVTASDAVAMMADAAGL